MKKLTYEGDDASLNVKILSDSNRIEIRGRRPAPVRDTASRSIYGANKIIEEGAGMTDTSAPVSGNGDRTQRRSFLIATPADATVR